MAKSNRFQDFFSAKKIGTGRLFRQGSFKSRSPKGLAGALRQTKASGKHSFAKNLSREDVDTFKGLIGEEMKKLPTHQTGLSRFARRRIMGRAEELRHQGKISISDKKDLRQIVEALKPNENQPVTAAENNAPSTAPKQRATSFFSRRQPGNEKTDFQANKHIRANIGIDIAEEIAAEERGELQQQYDPRSDLGKAAV